MRISRDGLTLSVDLDGAAAGIVEAIQQSEHGALSGHANKAATTKKRRHQKPPASASSGSGATASTRATRTHAHILRLAMQPPPLQLTRIRLRQRWRRSCQRGCGRSEKKKVSIKEKNVSRCLVIFPSLILSRMSHHSPFPLLVLDCSIPLP